MRIEGLNQFIHPQVPKSQKNKVDNPSPQQIKSDAYLPAAGSEESDAFIAVILQARIQELPDVRSDLVHATKEKVARGYYDNRVEQIAGTIVDTVS